jgi:hypothetical protein
MSLILETQSDERALAWFVGQVVQETGLQACRRLVGKPADLALATRAQVAQSARAMPHAMGHWL